MSGWVGLDVGTTSSKAVVYDDGGRARGAGSCPTRWDVTPAGVQIDPGAFAEGARVALGRALDDAPAELSIVGLGITSMGETGVLVDGHGAPVAPAIAWHDTRDATEVDRLERELGAETFGTVTGKPVRGQWSLTKHRWLVDNAPAARAAVRRFNVAEWVARTLGGDEACDRALAGRTGWYDLAAGTWWDQGLAWSGADARLMPALVPSGAPIGRVTDDAAHPRLRGALLTLAGHDHQAAALGAGAGSAGDEFDSCGTAEALVRTVPPTLTPQQVLTLARGGITTDPSIQPGMWSLLGGTEGGLALRRTLAVLGVPPDGLRALDELALAASAGTVTVQGVGGPALTLGAIADGTGPGDVWRAVVDTATAQAVALHRAMSAVVGPHRYLVAAGGWCHSAMVMAAKRAAFGPLTVAAVTQAGALGAATLAARAAGELGRDDALRSSP